MFDCSQIGHTSFKYFKRHLRLNEIYENLFNNNILTCFCLLLGHGLLVHQECTATSDTHCGVLPGYFCSILAEDAGCSLAVKHSRCDAGQRIKEPGKNNKS